MRPLQSVLIGCVVLLVTTGAAWAQSNDPAMSGKASSSAQTGTSAQGQATTPQPTTEPQPSASTQAHGETDATMNAQASADPDAALQMIRERAHKASSKGRAMVEKQLKKVSADVDAHAEAKGKAEAAGRVASEFGMTGDALVAETDQFKAGVRGVIIAPTLIGESENPGPPRPNFSPSAGGEGWGPNAPGVEFTLRGGAPGGVT